MKKLITLVLALVCVLGLVGCNQKAVSASEVYSFPEPTTMITVSFYSQGEETAFEELIEFHFDHIFYCFLFLLDQQKPQLL